MTTVKPPDGYVHWMTLQEEEYECRSDDGKFIMRAFDGTDAILLFVREDQAKKEEPCCDKPSSND